MRKKQIINYVRQGNESMFNFRNRIALVVALSALILPSMVQAAEITVGSDIGTVVLNSDNVGNVSDIPGTDAFQWTGNMMNTNMGWGLNWDLIIDPDPSISGVAAFTNLSGVTMNFTYNVTANSTIAIASPTVDGTSTITLVDNGNNGATMAALTGDSIYRAFINAATQETLFDDPYSLVAPANGFDLDGANWGPQAATVALAFGDVFGINHDFSLTAGDQATVNSDFNIVPEPATMMLLVLGGVSLIRRRR